jgi:hypothetical protein
MQNFYDTILKRNYWLLGYMSGNISKMEQAAKDFSQANNVPYNSIHIEQIRKSRNYDKFYYMFSIVDDQSPENGSRSIENVFKYLHD